MSRGTLLVIALIAVAATAACRTEVPHPNGLGAGDIAKQHRVQ